MAKIMYNNYPVSPAMPKTARNIYITNSRSFVDFNLSQSKQ